MTTIIVCIGLVAVLWGGWPLVARTAGDAGPTGALIMNLVAAIPIGIVMFYQGASMPSASITITFSIVGVMMGFGLIAFNTVAGSSLIDISASVPVINTSMLIVTTLGGIYFFSESVTPQKIIGIALMASGIMMLRYS